MALQNAHILPHPLKPSPLYLKKIKVCIFYKKQNVFHYINDENKFSSCTKSRPSKEIKKSHFLPLFNVPTQDYQAQTPTGSLC